MKARRRNPAGLCRFQPNAAANAVSVSIHIYAAIVGPPRHVYSGAGGIKPFIFGYANGPDTPVFGE